MFEIRHAGKFIHREQDQEVAEAWAVANLAHVDSEDQQVTVTPGKAFEVYADGCFSDSFDSLDEARAHAADLDEHTTRKAEKRFKSVEVRTQGEAVIDTPTDPAPPEPDPELSLSGS